MSTIEKPVDKLAQALDDQWQDGVVDGALGGQRSGKGYAPGDSNQFRQAGCQETLITGVKPTRFMEWCDNIKVNLVYLRGSIKTILFTGCSHGHGVSSTAINLAAALAKDSQLRVIVVDANTKAPTLHNKLKAIESLSGPIIHHDPMVYPVKIGAGKLYVLRYDARPLELGASLESSWFYQCLNTLSERFDYVILDAPPICDCPETLIISSWVDGVLLVIESGKIHRQVAILTKKQLEEAGAKLLGVVLNKRKQYIPDFIYKRL